jgi:large subunit ribosomal protein L1
MLKTTKMQKAIDEKVDRTKDYQIGDAVELLNQFARTKFKESIDISINLGIDARKSDQAVRGATTLPHGTGKSVRVAVFAEGEAAEKAKDSGADLVGLEDLAEKVKGGEMNFDVLISTPSAMKIVGQLGKILGPKGLMPNPKTGTVTPDVATAVENAKAGQIQFRSDKAGIVHGSVGQVGFGVEELKANIEALLGDLRKVKPASAKGVYLQKITLSTTMGPGIKIDQGSLEY